MRTYLLAGIAAFYLSGCLTVTRGTTDQVMVISKPPGAEVVAQILNEDGTPATLDARKEAGLECTPTPCGVVVPRKKHARIQVRKDGYQPIKFMVVSKGSSPTSTIRPGTMVAGTSTGSHVIAGTPQTITRFVSGNTLAAAQLFSTYGIGTLVDIASGANRSLSPNPVTVILAPIVTTVESDSGAVPQNEDVP